MGKIVRAVRFVMVGGLEFAMHKLSPRAYEEITLRLRLEQQGFEFVDWRPFK